MKDFIIIGHRGACYYEPENTLRSFKKALQLKCDYIECDVHLKKLNAGKKEKIPTLQEYIDLLKNKAYMFIELKKCKNIVEKTLEIINKNKIQDKVVLLSFHASYLRKVKKINNKIKTGLLSVRPLLAIKRAKLYKADFIGVYHGFLTKEFIEKCHKNKFKIFAYVRVVENPPKKYLKNLINLGLDGIALNKPVI